MNQSTQILAALQEGRRLTQLESIREFGTLRLGARIYDLRAKGHPIETERKKVGKGQHVAEYYLREV